MPISNYELHSQARAFDLNEADVQRDYVFGWIISGLFTESSLADVAVLKGGNALRKGYLPNTRFSDDLDFSSLPRARPRQGAAISSTSSVSTPATAPGSTSTSTATAWPVSSRSTPSSHVYKYRLYFKDLIGERDHITISLRVDMTEYDRLYLPVQDAADPPLLRCRRLHRHPAVRGHRGGTGRQDEVPAATSLLLRPVRPRLRRLRHARCRVDEPQLLNVFLRKTLFNRSPAAARSLLLDLPLDVFRGYWGKVLAPAAARFSFDHAVDSMRAGIVGLFTPYDGHRGGELSFYPSKLRNLILEAGAERRMLALTYGGVTRKVEPYSLRFKTRKSDGVGQEYLFVYDVTGGRTSGPGIKSLLHYNVQALEVLDEHFDPRFEVTLGKAGDASQTGTFTGGRRAGYGTLRSSGGRSSRTARRRPLTYAVYCPTCGRTFRRSTPSTRLNAHNTDWGSPCRNRIGHRA